MPSREYRLKGAFLFNFTQFVEWPTAAFSTNNSPWVIGILGDNPFGAALEEMVVGEKNNGHPVVVLITKIQMKLKPAISCSLTWLTSKTA